MRKLIFILTIFLTIISCRNYDSNNYINLENKAIQDIIPELIDYHAIVEMNNLDTNKLKLLLISTLGTEISDIYEPEGYVISMDEKNLPENEIKEGEKIYEEEYDKYIEEKRIFAPFIKGRISERIIDCKIEYSNLNVEIIQDKPENYDLKENEFGYLSLSRIDFNRSMDRGYLSFFFYCGDGCAWGYNVEITMIKGNWKISEYFSGGIA